MRFYIGLDLGQRQDHSAIAVVERREKRQAFQTEFEGLDVRRVERVPLGTPYPAVVERVRQLTQMRELWRECSLTVDATGVGAPVVDLLGMAELGCEICAVTITGGEKAQAAGSWPGVARWNVPKQDLIAGVQVLLEARQLRIARDMRETGRWCGS